MGTLKMNWLKLTGLILLKLEGKINLFNNLNQGVIVSLTFQLLHLRFVASSLCNYLILHSKIELYCAFGLYSDCYKVGF